MRIFYIRKEKYIPPSGLPVVNDRGETIGVTQKDGTIKITDIGFIKEINTISNKVLSISFKEEKS